MTCESRIRNRSSLQSVYHPSSSVLTMKCIAIFVMATLAYTNAGIVQYAGFPYPYPYVAHPHVVPAISQYSHVDYAAVPAAVHVHAPWPHVAYHHAPVVVAAPTVAVVKAPATYTAQTRGSLHTAPLEGHEVSQTALNLEPAPGSE